MMEAYDRDPSFIASDPPDHDRARRQCMRFFGPPHSPDVIPGQEPLCQQIVNELLDKASEGLPRPAWTLSTSSPIRCRST